MTRFARSVRAADPLTRGLFKLAAMCVVLLMLVAALGVALQAQTRAHQAQVGAQGSCVFYKDIATASIPDKTSTLGLRILADSRIAYVTLNCAPQFGQLPKPDPRLLPYLPSWMRVG